MTFKIQLDLFHILSLVSQFYQSYFCKKIFQIFIEKHWSYQYISINVNLIQVKT